MTRYRMGDHAPHVPASVFVAREATLIGQVHLGERASAATYAAELERLD